MVDIQAINNIWFGTLHLKVGNFKGLGTIKSALDICAKAGVH